MVVRREKICDNCCSSSKQPENAEKEGVTLMQFLDGLSADEQRAALIHLSVRWAEKQAAVNAHA